MAARRTADNSSMEQSRDARVLIDPSTGLHVGWYFWLRVLDEVNRSMRYGSPFGLLLLECTTPGSDRPRREAVAQVAALIRSTDLGGIVGPSRVGVLLVQQDSDSAAQARTRILERLASVSPQHVRWDDRLLVYPADGGEVSQLITHGWDSTSPMSPQPTFSQSA
jgi:hypothetical protein